MDALVAESNNNEGCGRWWMKGSMSRCDGRFGYIARRHDFHLNGNGLYCLGSPQYIDYLNRVQSYYPPGQITGRVAPGMIIHIACLIVYHLMPTCIWNEYR
jgi:hypothetical protein